MRNLYTLLPAVLFLGCGGASSAVETHTPASSARAEADGAAAAIEAAMAGTHRSEENRVRDAQRHPLETLTFFGLRPDMTVIELSPGGGWYTEILGPVLKDRGRLIVAMAPPEGLPENYAATTRAFTERLARERAIFGDVQIAAFAPPDRIELGPDGSADMVVTFRNAHGWLRNGTEDAVYGAVFRVLRSGGIFGVVAHRTTTEADDATYGRTGYITEARVIQKIEAAGFRLQERSDVNVNPRDTHDHPEGVWTLPPTLRLGDQDRARYEAIGETDRMTLRFVKP